MSCMSMNRTILFSVIASFSLSGCALKELFVYEPPHYKQSSFQVSKAQQKELVIIAEWLDYSQKAGGFSPTKRKKEMAKLKSSPASSDQVKRILLLTKSTSPKELEQAKKSAKELWRKAREDNNQILANFLQIVITQFESQHDAVHAANQLQQEKEQAKLLTKQINALKSIEKSIYEREYGFTDSGE